MKKFLFYSNLLLLIFIINSCQENQLNEVTQKLDIDAKERLYSEPIDIHAVTFRSTCSWVRIPAGSVDVLGAAITEVCENGIIYLESGVHTETAPITISKSVKIVGAEGAVLKLASNLSLPDPSTGALGVDPGLYVLNAPGTLIQDISIEPINEDAGTAILLENSDGSAVMRTRISNFQFGILVEQSDQVTMMFNTLVSTSLWQIGAVPTAHNIVVINGKSAYISDNTVSNGVFGIWACDQWGTCERNTVAANYVGIILCKVPLSFQKPDGTITGSQLSANLWKVQNNMANNNFTVGYLAIDGANNNLLVDNNASGNGTYDIELATESNRFGFITPESFENTVIAGAYPNISIKDCGTENNVTGGNQIDISTEPCN